MKRETSLTIQYRNACKHLGKRADRCYSEASVKCDNRIRQHETKDSVCNVVSQALADCKIQATNNKKERVKSLNGS